MAKTIIKETDWTAVAAKAQAFQALHLAGLNDKKKKLTDRARFLMTLGLSRSDAAGLLESSDDSLRILFAREEKKAATPRAKPEVDEA
jgi:hypothetical protein